SEELLQPGEPLLIEQSLLPGKAVLTGRAKLPEEASEKTDGTSCPCLPCPSPLGPTATDAASPLTASAAHVAPVESPSAPDIARRYDWLSSSRVTPSSS